MKLKEQVFKCALAQGNDFDLRKDKIGVMKNGQETEILLTDIFIRHALERDAIVGYSLLSYFELKDGALHDKDGNSISLFLVDKKVPLNIVKLDKKFVALDPIYVPLSTVEAFSTYLIEMKQPEVLFYDLENSEKKELVTNRELREQTKAKENAIKYEADLATKADALADAAVAEFTHENITAANKLFDEYQKLENAKPDTVKLIGDKITAAQNKRDEQNSARMTAQENEQRLSAAAQTKGDEAVAAPSQETIDAAVASLAEYQQLPNASEGVVSEVTGKINSATEALIAAKNLADKAKKDDAAKRGKVNPKFLYNEKEFAKVEQEFDENGGKKYTNGNYNFFYVPEGEEEKETMEPLLLIKGGPGWWEEPEEAEVVNKNDKVVVYEFKEDKKSKIVALDIEKGQITVEDAKKQVAQ